MAEEQTSFLTLVVTDEQRDFIYTSWLLNDWNLDVVDEAGEDVNDDDDAVSHHDTSDDGSNDDEDADLQDEARSSDAEGEEGTLCENCGVAVVQDAGPSQDNDEAHDPRINTFRIQEYGEAPECPYCLCHPCVTDDRFRQMWWEVNPHPPSTANSSLRKNHYQRFWVMLLHRGAWDKPIYKQRKDDALKNRQNYAWSGPNRKHPSDIMPKCVLQLVRSWLPNPTGKPYMGHKWS